MLKDIRETPDEEYWEDLRRRWTSLLSYRYIGRNHGSMNTGPIDNTVTLRHDMRNAAGAEGRVGVRTTLHDEGDDDRAITSGSVVFRRVD